MPMNTRSSDPPAAPAVASKATKTTVARKASQAKGKSSEANSNRVQKPVQQLAPTRRNARGYVWIDEDSHTVDNDNESMTPPARLVLITFPICPYRLPAV